MKNHTRSLDARAHRAFTLIELLVVIAIVAILAAILFPVFAQAKLAAKKTAGLSNTKQVTLAMMQYIGDSDGAYPDSSVVWDEPAVNGVSCANLKDYAMGYRGGEHILCFGQRAYRSETDQTPSGHMKLLLPYIKNEQVFQMPGGVRERRANRWVPWQVGSSFYVRHALDAYAFTKRSAVNESIIGQPASLSWLFSESWYSGRTPWLWSDVNVGTKMLPAGFFDGHVTMIKKEFRSDLNEPNYDMNWYLKGHQWDLTNMPEPRDL